jgi:hypothetical protein
MTVKNTSSKPILLTIFLGRDIINGQIQAVYPIDPGCKFDLSIVGLEGLKKVKRRKK